MAENERCDVCGFTWDDLDADAIALRIRFATSSFAELLESSPAESSMRPEKDRWSALEYGCHVRDLLFNLRDRIILGAVEDEPICSPMYGTPRVDLGLYEAAVPSETAPEIRMAGEVFARTWNALPDDLRRRSLIYSVLVGRRSLEWVAAQALHESEHHLLDRRLRAGH